MIQRTGRDNARTPMQWSAAPLAGFTAGPAAWIKVNHNSTRINMEAQQADNHSVLAFYRQLLAFRKNTQVLREGTFRAVKISRRLFVFERALESGNAENVSAGERIPSVLVLINLGKKPSVSPARGKSFSPTSTGPLLTGSSLPMKGILIQPD